MKPLKFNPTNINDFENLDLESEDFESQQEYASRDPFIDQALEHNEEDMKMKKEWLKILQNYLTYFTSLMFFTLWLGKLLFKIDDTTLNFLITVGFVKVISVVGIVIWRLFPSNRYSFPNKK